MIAVPLTSILKTTVSLLVLVANEVCAANKVGGIDGDDELIEKYRKLLKTGKTSKGQKLSKSGNLKGIKLFKSRKLAKSKKKLLKSGNSPNFNAKDNKPSFLTPKARAVFNRLRLAFTKAPIL